MFFQTNEGRLHAGRIAGALYMIAIVPVCVHFRDPILFRWDHVCFGLVAMLRREAVESFEKCSIRLQLSALL